MPILGSILKSAIELRNKLPHKQKPAAIVQQKKTLKKILSKASETAFGEYYDFSGILNSKNIIDKFSHQIPTHDYNSMHSKWWYRCLNGESYVCWPGKIKYFALSSGTSEASSKYIPITSDMVKAIKRTSIRQIMTLAYYDFPKEFYQKGILMLGGSTHLNFNGTYYEGDLSGITAGNIPFWFQHFYKPGKRISKERDWPTKLEEIVKSAKDWDIGAVVGVPAWIQILLEKVIEHYQLNNIHEIWPNLTIYVHGGVSFTPYHKGFEKLLAKPLTYMETYLASEGFIAYQSRPDTCAMELVLDNGIYFEFVPFTQDNFDDENNIISNPKVLNISQVELNTEYALLITTVSGAYRYLIGDVIKFVDLEKNEIVITGRTKHFLSICGEHMSQDNMNRAIQLTEEQMNINIREFSVCGIKSNTLWAHKWYIGTDDNVKAADIAKAIDDNLKVINDDYRVERLEAIKEVLVEVLSPTVFYDWMKERGKEGGQNKFPRVLKNAHLEDWTNYIKNKTTV